MSQLVAPANMSAQVNDPLVVLAENGKTFNWARRVLGADMGLAAARLYAFCRHADDIADGDKPGGITLLSEIDAALAGEGSPPDMQTRDFLAFAHEENISLAAARDLLGGLLFDQGAVEIETTQDLLVYCYQAAGTVGLMMASVLNCRDKDALAHAVCLGMGMQLTNIARDIAEDAAMGRRYVPAVWCAHASPAEIETSTLMDRPVRADMQDAIEALLKLADRYYAHGYRGLAALPLRAHFSIAIAGYCYQAIGHKLRRNRNQYWQSRTVVGLGGKIIASMKSLVTLRLRLFSLQPVADEMLAPLKRSDHVRSIRK